MGGGLAVDGDRGRVLNQFPQAVLRCYRHERQLVDEECVVGEEGARGGYHGAVGAGLGGHCDLGGSHFLGGPQLAGRVRVPEVEVHAQAVLLCDLLDAAVQVGNDEKGVRDLDAADGGQAVGGLVPNLLGNLGLVSLLVGGSNGLGRLVRHSGAVEGALISRRVRRGAGPGLLGEGAGVELGQVLFLGPEVDAGAGERVGHVVLDLLGRGF